MSLTNFEGETFVAFVDISGFKDKVRANTETATDTLKTFYNIGYTLLSHIGENKDISGIFVSDCAILYVHNKKLSVQDKCGRILDIVKELNKECIEKNIMLTTNIAYGNFVYKNRIEVDSNIEKSLVLGNAYIDAYIDSTKKMKACCCRMLKKRSVNNVLDNNNSSIDDDVINSIKTSYVITDENGYYYFWWQCKTEEKVNIYMERYKEIKKQYKGKDKVNEKFDKLCELTKNFSNETEQN